MYNTRDTIDSYKKDFVKAMQGQKFMVDVEKTLPQVLEIMTEDDLADLLEDMYNPEYLVMRKSFKGYLAMPVVRVYNILHSECMKRQSGLMQKALFSRDITMYLSYPSKML